MIVWVSIIVILSFEALTGLGLIHYNRLLLLAGLLSASQVLNKHFDTGSSLPFPVPSPKSQVWLIQVPRSKSNFLSTLRCLALTSFRNLDISTLYIPFRPLSLGIVYPLFQLSEFQLGVFHWGCSTVGVPTVPNPKYLSFGSTKTGRISSRTCGSSSWKVEELLSFSLKRYQRASLFLSNRRVKTTENRLRNA